MRSFVETARTLMRPIPDAELPKVAAEVLGGTRGLALTGAIFTVLSGITDSVLGTYLPVYGQVYAVTSTAIFLGIHALSRTGWAARHPHALHFALGMVILCLLGLGMLVHHPGEAELSTYAPVTPLVVAAFAPVRPMSVLLLSGPTLLLAMFNHTRGEEQGLAKPAMAAFVGIMCCVVGALAAQQRRRVLRQLAAAQFQLAAAERMSALGRMTAGVAHELKTPLAAAATANRELERLSDELSASIGHADVTEADLHEIAGELSQTVQQGGQAVRRASRFVQSIAGHMRGTAETTPQSFSVAERVAGVLELLAFRTRASRVAVDTAQIQPGSELRGDPGHFDQILTNLLVNAFDACEGAGVGTVIRVGTRERKEGAVLFVEDDGPGVLASIRGLIFEPLFTTRSETGGTGLGLTISRDLAESRFGGSLELVDSAGGARFEVYFPHEGGRDSGRPAWVPVQGVREVPA